VFKWLHTQLPELLRCAGSWAALAARVPELARRDIRFPPSVKDSASRTILLNDR